MREHTVNSYVSCNVSQWWKPHQFCHRRDIWQFLQTCRLSWLRVGGSYPYPLGQCQRCCCSFHNNIAQLPTTKSYPAPQVKSEKAQKSQSAHTGYSLAYVVWCLTLSLKLNFIGCYIILMCDGVSHIIPIRVRGIVYILFGNEIGFFYKDSICFFYWKVIFYVLNSRRFCVYTKSL